MTVSRRQNTDTRECRSHTAVYVYVRFWTVNDVQVANTETSACIESNHLHTT